MACSNDVDCQDVLSNTVCTSLQCTCAAGFTGLGKVQVIKVAIVEVKRYLSKGGSF